MNITIKDQNNTSTTLSVVATKEDLAPAKENALREIGKNIKIQGFRKGKAPAKEVEKNADQAVLTDKFLNLIVPELVGRALDEHKISTVIAPQVNVTKLVPFTDLEIEILAEYVGEVKLADYKKVKRSKPETELEKEDITNVLKRIQMDLAERKDVERKSKTGDQVWIDFDGVDKNGEEVTGASGKDYPLNLGSNTFIPGFEENLDSLAAGDKKEFTLTFPEDYGVKALSGSEVTFSVVVNKIQEVLIPEIDDELAAKVGPYKNVKELEADIEKQVLAEKTHKATLDLESDIMQELVDKTEAEIPAGMLKEQIQRMVSDHASNLEYRGLSYEQWLKDQETTDEDYRKSLEDQALNRLKGGIVLSEISKAEGIEITDAEIEVAMSQYRQQFASDQKMLDQLKSPSAKRDISARILTDKALAKLKEIVIK